MINSLILLTTQQITLAVVIFSTQTLRSAFIIDVLFAECSVFTCNPLARSIPDGFLKRLPLGIQPHILKSISLRTIHRLPAGIQTADHLTCALVLNTQASISSTLHNGLFIST